MPVSARWRTRLSRASGTKRGRYFGDLDFVVREFDGKKISQSSREYQVEAYKARKNKAETKIVSGGGGEVGREGEKDQEMGSPELRGAYP